MRIGGVDNGEDRERIRDLEAMMGRVIQKSESVSEFVNYGLSFFFFHILVLQCKTTSFCTDNLFKKKNAKRRRFMIGSFGARLGSGSGSGSAR